MPRKLSPIRLQIRAALDAIFGRKKKRARPTSRPRPRPAPPKRAPRLPAKPARAKKKRLPPAPVPPHDEPKVDREVERAPATGPDAVAAPTEAEPAGREAPATGRRIGEFDLAAALSAEPEPPRRRVQRPRHCTFCGDLGHDRRNCQKLKAAGGESAPPGGGLPVAADTPPRPPVEDPPPPPPPPNTVHEARVAEFRRLAAHFPLLNERAQAVARLVAQGYDPGAIAGDLRLKRFDVYQLLEWATTELRLAEERNPTPAPAAPVATRPVIDPKPTHEDPEEPEIVEDRPPISAQYVPPLRTGVGRGHGVRRCRRCHRPGHITKKCDLEPEDLIAARLQDIAAACVRLRLSPAPPPRQAIPVKALPPIEPPPVARVDWAALEGFEEEFGPFPELPPALPAAAPEAPTASLEIEPGDAGDPVASIVAIRRKVRDVNGRVRGKTLQGKHLTRDEVRAAELVVYPDEVLRPLERGDCEKDPGRPCPWVSCAHHLYLDVNPETGSIKFNFPHLEVWEIPETCSLDVADRGGITLKEVGAIINLTREGILQVEVRGLEKMKNDDSLDLPP